VKRTEAPATPDRPADRPELASTGFASVEAPSTNRPVTQAPACLGTTKSGRPCGGTPTTSSGGRYCPQHDPQFNADQRRAWRRRGALTTLQMRRAQQPAPQPRAQTVARLEPTLAAVQPRDIGLPPTPADIALDWSSIEKCRSYLESIGREVVNRRMSVSIAEQMRKLTESTMRALDLALDAQLAARLNGDE